MKLKLLAVLLSIIVVSCSKKNVSEDTQPSSWEHNSSHNDKSERGILKSFSTFEVEVPSAPITIAQYSSVYNSSATGNYSGPVYMDFALNDDNTIDVFWISSAEKWDGMFRQDSKYLCRVSLSGKNIVRQLVIPTLLKKRDSRFLGFKSLGNDQFVVGHSSVAEQTSQGAVSIEGGKTVTEAYYTNFNGNNGAIRYTTPVWKDPSITYENFGGPKYLPGQASTPVIGYNRDKDLLAVYMGHRMEAGHQGGFFAMMKASTGELITKITGGKKYLVGHEWNYSHIFDMRLMPTTTGSADFYTLSHLDALPKRSLMFTAWNAKSGRMDGQLPYLDAIPGTGNQTYSKTGDFLELPNGDIATVYATGVKSPADYQGALNVKLAIISGAGTSNARVKKEVWLSDYPPQSIIGAGPGMQLGLSADKKEILVCWNTFNGNIPVKTAFRMTDLDGNITSTIEESGISLLYHGQSMKRTPDGKLIFVSHGEGNKLLVNAIQ
ncbi:hypothetical protein OQZ33_23455 [Pedobacter sp. MC2016-05]|uniref:hypothetical protein n=1 Tax=Pedobacter sp. MC2016-05 TaxID=2994474 RepID=UPI002247ADAD|nr:hypothetical protein [Pedobacter sp. MC2016-05]MCX2477311.1 hypothetical protein [Pedobacter sp. MC2016-05]